MDEHAIIQNSIVAGRWEILVHYVSPQHGRRRTANCGNRIAGGRWILILTIILPLCMFACVCGQMEGMVHSSFRKLSGREKKEMQKEILSILGLPGRPRPHPPLRPPSSAPLFMLDLYHAVSSEGEEGPVVGFIPESVSHAALPTLSTHTPPLGTVVSEADTVMSFVNLGEWQMKCFGLFHKILNRSVHRYVLVTSNYAKSCSWSFSFNSATMDIIPHQVISISLTKERCFGSALYMIA